jgi:predicted transcriptional regulator
MATSKTMSLRLDEEQARALDAVAMAQETTVSNVVRDAIDERLKQLRTDKDFQTRLKNALNRNREALELLAK